jgi:magnesium chelatase accessory protein
MKADGLDWHVVEAGQGPTVLLVHGTAASVHSWRKVIPVLADTNHVVALDLPGHGQTRARNSADFGLERMARGVAALMTAMKLSPSTVVGHSAGAAILVEACAKGALQAERFVSFNGAFFPYGGAAASLFSPIAKLIALSPFVPHLLSYVAKTSTVERLLRDTGSKIDAESVDAYLQLFKQPDHVAAALGMMAAWDLSGMESALSRVQAQCVFVAGGRDTAVPPQTAEKAASRCRKAGVLHIAEYGHLLHEENPVLAADIIRGNNT